MAGGTGERLYQERLGRALTITQVASVAVGYWKKHQKKDLEALLVEFDALGWRVEDPPKYYTVKCPCGAHKRSIHLTPSDPRYAQNARQWMQRQDCSPQPDTTDANTTGEETAK